MLCHCCERECILCCRHNLHSLGLFLLTIESIVQITTRTTNFISYYGLITYSTWNDRNENSNTFYMIQKQHNASSFCAGLWEGVIVMLGQMSSQVINWRCWEHTSALLPCRSAFVWAASWRLCRGHCWHGHVDCPREQQWVAWGKKQPDLCQKKIT